MSAVSPSPDPWIRESQDPNFLKSVEQNINELERTVSGPNRVSVVFFDILQKDIDLLRAEYTAKNLDRNGREFKTLDELNTKLGHLATVYAAKYHVSIPGSEDPVEVPLASPLANVQNAFRDDEVAPEDKAALVGCSAIRIRGEGHCFFRAVAAHLFTGDHLDALQRRLANLQQMVPQTLNLGALIDESHRRRERGDTVDHMLQDENFSNQWVFALRNISAQWWNTLLLKQPRTPEENASLSTFLADIRSSQGVADGEDDRAVMAQYAVDMGSLESKRWGGQEEAVALENALGIPIYIADLQTPLAQRKDGRLLPQVADVSDIFLLRRPGHFDALFVQQAP